MVPLAAQSRVNLFEPRELKAMTVVIVCVQGSFEAEPETSSKRMLNKMHLLRLDIDSQGAIPRVFAQTHEPSVAIVVEFYNP